ncbi:hypothetical protein HanPSC8_Chr11g0489531 [Helianthus annuus]|nr:hypothetical protein HanPSC8_Chr11g0489531 [Helianthus annuus]
MSPSAPIMDTSRVSHSRRDASPKIHDDTMLTSSCRPQLVAIPFTLIFMINLVTFVSVIAICLLFWIYKCYYELPLLTEN